MQTARKYSILKIVYWSTLALFLTIAQVAFGQPVKIMPLGDSLTHGYRQWVSYRYDLWFDLLDAGFEVDFVGRNMTTDGNPNLDWYPDYLTTFDRNHEGYSGYRTDELAEFARNLALLHTPDIVLLWAGINDIWAQGAGGVVNARFGLRDTIQGIRSAVPGVTILLGLIPPYDQANAEFVEPLNDEIIALAAVLDSPQSPIILVDHHTGYNTASMTWDGVHQNRAGEEWVANNWFGALADIMPETTPFEINAGLNDAWYDPLTDGQGMLISVLPESGTVFLAWFTYDTELPPEDALADVGDPGHRWLTAQGAYADGQAVMDITIARGGIFDAPSDVRRTDPPGSDGTLLLTFDDCYSGTIEYDISSIGRQGIVPIQRVVNDNAALCEQLADPETDLPRHDPEDPLSFSPDNPMNPGLNDAWYDPQTDGQGILISVLPDTGTVFLAWFSYDTELPPEGATANLGDPGHRWLTAQGPYNGGEAVMNLVVTSGGLFDHPTVVERTDPPGSDGTVTLAFEDCHAGTLEYQFPTPGLQRTIPIQRVVTDNVPLCEWLMTTE